jgi:hypothetical protein
LLPLPFLTLRDGLFALWMIRKQCQCKQCFGVDAKARSYSLSILSVCEYFLSFMQIHCQHSIRA